MNIIYRNRAGLKYGHESEFVNLVKPKFGKEWYMGIDGSSTSYGLAIYDYNYEEVHLFIFCRESIETAETFRETMYQWLQNYLYGVAFEVVTYEKTPEGYKPPTSHAEKVMRETEAAIKNFVSNGHYLMIKSKDKVFDIFPNSWKFFSVPKSTENLGKVNKELNAIGVLESCGLEPSEWLSGFNRIPYKHDYDCFEALGVGRYGSHFIEEDGKVKIYKNFSKIGSSLIVGKRISTEEDLSNELEFVGRFGNGRVPRLCSLNENHSVPENLLGLYDKEFNNILTVEKSSPLSIYLDVLFGFDLTDKRDYLILGTRTSKTDLGVKICKKYGYTPVYI